MKISHYKIYGFFLFALALTACKKDYLSFDFNEGPVYENDIWGSDRYARGFLNDIYTNLQSRYDLGGGAILADASDDAICSNFSNSINRITNGTWGPIATFDDQYGNYYAGLRGANQFLEKSKTSSIFPATDIPKLRGEAFFLRAMFHFELFKRYGKIVLATRILKADEDLDLPRNSIEEVVQQISMDCDSAANLIPAISVSDWDNANKGRATKIAALALKSRLLLYAASPLNTANDNAKWLAAATAAKAVLDLNKQSLLPVGNYPNLFNFSILPYNNEVIFATTAVNTNSIESVNAPVGFTGGLGRTNPSQNLVDAFEMKTGIPINTAGSGYDPSNPYANRDPRLNFAVVTNASNFKTGSLSRPVETFDGGLDNVATNQNSTKTGYYLRKFLNDGATFNIASPASVRRPWVLFRYAEIYLNYAEALNETMAMPNTDVYNAVNVIRNRVGMPSLPANLTQLQMRDRIHNERRVEFCFEEQRFYDVRRWKEGEIYFNAPLRGMKIAKSGSVLTYTPFTVENRIFSAKNYLFPISQSQLNKAPKLGQNTGY
jgi:hypothetical protein